MIKVVQRVNLVGKSQRCKHKVQSNWISTSIMGNVSGVSVSHKNNVSPESHTVSNKVNILKFRKKNIACEKWKPNIALSQLAMLLCHVLDFPLQQKRSKISSKLRKWNGIEWIRYIEDMMVAALCPTTFSLSFENTGYRSQLYQGPLVWAWHKDQTSVAGTALWSLTTTYRYHIYKFQGSRGEEEY